MKPAWKFLAAGLTAAVLLAVAFAAAFFQARGIKPPPHDFPSFLSANALAATVVMATGAFVLFILQRSGTPLPGWLAFWTFAFIAFVVHIVAGRAGPEAHLSRSDAVVAAWWGIDLLLAWTASTTRGPVRLARGRLHVVVFALLLVTVARRRRSGTCTRWGCCWCWLRSRLRPYESWLFRSTEIRSAAGSSSGPLTSIDRFVPWHRLPTPLGVLNLAAFREVLRAKNLHDTSTCRSPGPKD